MTDNKKYTSKFIGYLGSLSANINRKELYFNEIPEIIKFSLEEIDYDNSYIQLLYSAFLYITDNRLESISLCNKIDKEFIDMNRERVISILLNMFICNDDPEIMNIIKYDILKLLHKFYKDLTLDKSIQYFVIKLRDHVYKYGTPRELLVGDVIFAIVRKMFYDLGKSF